MKDIKDSLNTITWINRTMKPAVPELAEPISLRLKHYGALVIKGIKRDGDKIVYQVNARCAQSVTNELGAFIDGFLKARAIYHK